MSFNEYFLQWNFSLIMIDVSVAGIFTTKPLSAILLMDHGNLLATSWASPALCLIHQVRK
jgi:hypothetical protein